MQNLKFLDESLFYKTCGDESGLSREKKFLLVGLKTDEKSDHSHLLLIPPRTVLLLAVKNALFSSHYHLAQLFAFSLTLDEWLDFDGVLLVDDAVRGGLLHVPAARLEEEALARPVRHGGEKSENKIGKK